MDKSRTTLEYRNSQVMDLRQLIAGPLVAAVEADAMASQKYYEYLLRIAFEDYETAEGKYSRLRMLSFNFSEPGSNGGDWKTINIPLITLLPLPLLQLQEADFDFDIRIIDAISETTKDSFSYKSGKMTEGIENPSGFRMRANIAPQTSAANGDMQKNLSANMKIKVKMRQSDMPSGLMNLLRLASGDLDVRDSDAGEYKKEQKEGGEENV